MDLTTNDAEGSLNDAYFIQVNPAGSEGTGNINPFLTVQANGTESGANTMGDTTRDEVTGGSRTKAIRLDAVTQLACPEGDDSDGICREFALDINESNSTPLLSLDDVIIWLCTNPNVDGDDIAPPGDQSLPGCTQVFDLDGNGSDNWVEMNYALEAGSGSGDVRMYIEEEAFLAVPGAENCDYDAGQGSDCNLWLVMYTQYGLQPGMGSDAGFEEWGIRLLPFVTVEKTAETTVTRQAMWEITKSVDPAQWDLFTGDDGTSEYTIEVERLEGQEEDIEWAVEGTITISNTSGSTVTISSVADVIEGIGATPVTCPAATPFTIANNGSVVCTYGPVDLPDGTERDNTATVEVLNGVTADDTITFDFADPDNVEIVDGEVYVDDTNDDGDQSGITDDTTYTYTRTFSCDDDEGTHDNTAELFNADDVLLDSDDASVVVNCYDLTVAKDADTELTRTWEWTIDKTGEDTNLILAVGQTFLDFTYTVTVDTSGSSDSDWNVSGDITVTNNNPVLAATINDVSDIVSPDIAADVDCGVTFPTDIAASGVLNCTYEADLPDGTDRTNTATATLQNFSYDEDLNATASGTTDFDSPAVDVLFAGATVIEVDECIDVTDDFGTPGDTGDDQDLGQVCITDALPADLTYDRDFGPFGVEDCGLIEITNRATFVAIDTEATDFAEFLLTIEVTCPVSCTLTQGYWKTHNETFHGGAPPDDTWNELPGGLAEETLFFSSGQTWFEVFWTAPAGNVYYNLAHQYMAAVLNVLNDADGSLIAAELAAAEQFFNDCSPGQVASVKGNQTIACSTNPDLNTRNEVTALAGILASFNEGTLPGTEHCDEDETSSD